jgi:ferredoxin
MSRYTIRIDREACTGIFACLVRDDRFVEADDGTATIDGDASGIVERADEGTERTITLEEGDGIENAQQAAAACPVDAITVEEH